MQALLFCPQSANERVSYLPEFPPLVISGTWTKHQVGLFLRLQPGPGPRSAFPGHLGRRASLEEKARAPLGGVRTQPVPLAIVLNALTVPLGLGGSWGAQASGFREEKGPDL